MSVTIEKAFPSDAGVILEYLKQVGGETDNLTFGETGLPFSVEDEAAYIAGMENSSDNIMLVAKDGRKIVGIASLDRLPRRMSHRGDFGLSVARDYWGQGIGSRMMEEILNFARAHAFEIVDLQVRSDNLRAIRLYEKYGFQKVGIHPAYLKINNGDISSDYMYLRLE